MHTNATIYTFIYNCTITYISISTMQSHHQLHLSNLIIIQLIICACEIVKCSFHILVLFLKKKRKLDSGYVRSFWDMVSDAMLLNGKKHVFVCDLTICNGLSRLYYTHSGGLKVFKAMRASKFFALLH